MLRRVSRRCWANSLLPLGYTRSEAMADRLKSWSGVSLPPEIDLAPDPVIEAYKKDIDRTLVQQSLRLTVEERVRSLMEMGECVAEARRRRSAQ